MSAVGLLLLEDPKARARAEAKIRSGQTERRSLFGRSGSTPSQAPPSRSGAAPAQAYSRSGAALPKRPSPASAQAYSRSGYRPKPPPKPVLDDEGNPVIVRPSTSLSLLSGGKKKSGSERSSSRNSIFGRKSSTGGSSIRSANSGDSQYSGTRSTSSYAADRQLHSSASQSRSISGTPLATVEEKGLPLRARTSYGPEHSGLQSAGAHRTNGSQGPRGGLISADPPSLPPAARMSAFDDTIFNSVTPSPPESREDTTRTAPLAQVGSSLESLSSLECSGSDAELKEHIQPAQPAENLSTAAPPSADQHAQVRTDNDGLHEPAVQSDDALRQFADELPSRNVSSGASLRSNSTSSSDSHDSPEIRIDYTLRPHPSETADLTPSMSRDKSPALSFTSGVRESTVFSDSTWEDEIDYIYEQGAEAACDFEWEFDSNGRYSSAQSDGGVRMSRGSSAFPPSASSAASDISRRDSRTLSGVIATIEERRQGQQAAKPIRGSFVGHRGFAAARFGEDGTHKLSVPPTHTHPGFTQPIKDGGILYHFPTADGETSRSPLTPNIMHFPVPPGGLRQSDSLSDPESWRNGPMHRKSSSYGSVESVTRTPTTTSSTKDGSRWSVASQSSAPSLIHSRPPKRTSSINKTSISAPVTVLPQHPENDRAFEVEQRPGEPGRPSDSNLLQDVFVMRRPQTSGERLLLQAAGKQRYRPATPNGPTPAGASRIPHEPTAEAMPSSVTSGSSWI